MKLILILLIVFSYQDSVKAGSMFDFFAGKIREVISDIGNSFKGIKIGFQRLFDHSYYRNQQALRVKTIREKIETTTGVYPRVESSRRIYSQIEQTSDDSHTVLPYLNVVKKPKPLKRPYQIPLNAMHFNQSSVYGHKFESHRITTHDGYLLIVHRMTASGNTTTNKTVLLHHGLLGSSADWLLLGANSCLPSLLATAGYDVWISNARGNYYSRKHVNLNVASLEYWNFTFHEIGMYDIPATIDYIKNAKNFTNETIDFIGHSMGATALLVTLSLRPEYNNKLRMAVFLAPLAFMSHVNGPFRMFSAMAEGITPQLFEILGENGEFLPSRRVPDWLFPKKCFGPKIFCRNPVLYLCGGIPQLTTRDPNFVAKIMYHVPAGGSTKTLLHYVQLNKTGKFHEYDNSSLEYPLNKVNLSIAMISSNDDWLSNIADVKKLYQSISNPFDHYYIRDQNISHPDFIWGIDADKLIYRKVLEFLVKGPIIINSTINEIL